MIRKNVAGLSIGGGRKENFFFCLLEFFPDSNRWFLASVNQLREEGIDGDEVIRNWIDEFTLRDLVVDFPLSTPACETCDLVCPGINQCPVDSVVNVRKMLNHFLDQDAQQEKENPKKYEQERNQHNEVDYFKNEFGKISHEPMMSKAFKRKLKKGFLPYWNRPLDFWVWKHYYDPLLNIFNISYESFGNVSMMLLSRFKYLKRHFPKDLLLHESNVQLALLELYRSGIITKTHLQELGQMDMAVHARYTIIKLIEKKLSVFMYDKDQELLIKHPRAFDSFILALAGKQMIGNQIRTIEAWANPEVVHFVIPHFESI